MKNKLKIVRISVPLKIEIYEYLKNEMGRTTT